jgi:hypothetical protein
MEMVVNCMRSLISPRYHRLTGKTISANFDPWGSDDFVENLAEISQSDMFALRRMNLANLPHGALREKLSRRWSRYANEL